VQRLSGIVLPIPHFLGRYHHNLDDGGGKGGQRAKGDGSVVTEALAEYCKAFAGNRNARVGLTRETADSSIFYFHIGACLDSSREC
jgi:hypothetical protein